MGKNEKNYQDYDLSAYFIGAKSENGSMFKDILTGLIDDHLGWRKNFVTDDKEMITEDEKQSENFINAEVNMKNVLHDLSRKLRSGSIPWTSAGRYWGHMNNETLMPAILAYDFAMLWNGNNVAWEGAPAATLLEQEVGEDFSKMMGYGDKGWGHIAADGTIANIEGLWYARNLKSIPLAVKEVCPELVEGKSEWELLNMDTKDILDLLDKTGDKKNEVKAHSAKSGKNIQKLGKWLVPATMHYSWPKSADILGVGEDNLVPIPVDDHFRTNVKELEKLIRGFVDQQIPILGVVSVVGSTEEGAVDNVADVVALRNKLAKEGIHFYLHVDAAYGGYGRTAYLDEDGNFIPYEDLEKVYKENNIFTEDNPLMERHVYDAYKAFADADSITVDPHKMGYIPYDAGGIAIKDTRMKNMLTYEAPYAFEKGIKVPASIGLFTLEGSKPAASAAAVWAAHRTLPLNVTGYGRLIAHTSETAVRMVKLLDGLTFKVNGKEIQAHILTDPDFNMINWTYQEVGNNSLADMNKLTRAFFEYTSSSKGGNLYNLDFVTSHTVFAKDIYGDSPLTFIKSLGINGDEWNQEKKLVIMRASCMSPYAWDEKNFDYWAPRIKEAMQNILQEIADREDILK